MMHFVYTIFITNDQAPFHMSQKIDNISKSSKINKI